MISPQNPRLSLIGGLFDGKDPSMEIPVYLYFLVNILLEILLDQPSKLPNIHNTFQKLLSENIAKENKYQYQHIQHT